MTREPETRVDLRAVHDEYCAVSNVGHEVLNVPVDRPLLTLPHDNGMITCRDSSSTSCRRHCGISLPIQSEPLSKEVCREVSRNVCDGEHQQQFLNSYRHRAACFSIDAHQRASHTSGPFILLLSIIFQSPHRPTFNTTSTLIITTMV